MIHQRILSWCSYRKKTLLLGFIVFGAVTLIWGIKRLFLLFLGVCFALLYDPEGVALEVAQQYLDAAYNHPTAVEEELLPSCGGHWSYGCLEFLQGIVVDYPKPYTLEIVYRNWEDGFCVMPDGEAVHSYKGTGGRGGDEVVIQATFSNQQTVIIHTYEGCVEQCYEGSWQMPTCPTW